MTTLDREGYVKLLSGIIDDVAEEQGMTAFEMLGGKECNGYVITGGALMHSADCPVHGRKTDGEELYSMLIDIQQKLDRMRARMDEQSVMLDRIMPLVERAEQFLAKTPMQRIRNSLK